MRPTPRIRRRTTPTTPAALFLSRRLALGLTQQDVADLAEISVRTVQAAEGGAVEVRVQTVVRLADALGLGVAVLPRAAADQRAAWFEPRPPA